MDPPASHRISVPRGTQEQNRRLSFYLPGFHRLWPAFPEPFRFSVVLVALPYNPARRTGRFRLFPFRSPLLGESFLFLRVLRCFSSPGSLRLPMCSEDDTRAFPRVGFPIRKPPAQSVAHTLPGLFAVYRVLLRLLTPRHSPYALSSFTLRDTEKLMFSLLFTC